MLDGIRIIEVEGLGPGPFAAMTLADLGADVVVVHRKGGNPTPGVPERSVLDRGKRSIALDLKDADDLDVFRRLVAGADGLIEGFRPGVMEKLGMGPAACHAINPALVFGRMTGWGQDGPLSHAAGHDLNYISMSGALWYAGVPGDAPVTPATLVGDIGGGALYLVVGMLAGIMQARATGRGTVVDAAIYDGSAHMMNLLMSLRQGGGMPDARGQGILDGPHWCRSYQTRDGGWMSVQCLEPKFYQIFLELLGLGDDPDFADQFDRALWPRATERLKTIFASKTRDEWADLFLGTDACVAPVLSPDEAAAHDMNAARGAWAAPGGVLQAAPAPRFAGQPDWQPKAAPARGEHTDEILAELATK
ncbi:CaiB/BaiF CoA transferase family protein [Aquicoccus porphyridii]|uniref:CaiB/BaiF CoA transferase family protein n=1 Tax=Aquicoccus porphyridii TaxID=1852029 RepID=UPI00273DE231|nr:CaiB/BaiF CoA-transferase family protein [Aquicoccus porphyridii]